MLTYNGLAGFAENGARLNRRKISLQTFSVCSAQNSEKVFCEKNDMIN
jgi:hypothetical protein